MSRVKTVQIGNHEWKYQKDALLFYKEILNAYKIDDSLIGEDFDEIFNLIKNHPNAVSKIGCGIESIFIAGDGYDKQCFHIKRTDGNTENFSYIKAVVGEASSFTIFSKACRKAVEPDMIKAKEKAFGNNATIKCQETRQDLTPEQAHIDHRPPNTFSVIVDRFREVENISLDSVEYVSVGQYGRVFADDHLSNSFIEYHKKMAKLRIVSKDLNLRRSYLGRVNTQKKDILIE